MNKVDSYVNLVTSNIEDSSLITVLHQRSNVSKHNITKGALGMLTLFCVTSHGSQICSFFIGTMYPIYISCCIFSEKSITKTTLNEQDLHKYWVVWMVFTRLEIALLNVTAFIPLFHQIKLLTFFVNAYNSFKMSTHTFENIILPIFEYCDNTICVLALEKNTD